MLAILLMQHLLPENVRTVLASSLFPVIRQSRISNVTSRGTLSNYMAWSTIRFSAHFSNFPHKQGAYSREDTFFRCYLQFGRLFHDGTACDHVMNATELTSDYKQLLKLVHLIISIPAEARMLMMIIWLRSVECRWNRDGRATHPPTNTHSEVSINKPNKFPILVPRIITTVSL